jgi:5-methyltetrahydrofolate--homocysteine methyltransferase
MNDEISDAVLNGNVYDIEEILERRLGAGVEPVSCIEAMMAGLDETGKLFENGEYFLPEMVMAADTFKTGMEVLTPRLAGKAREYKGTIVLGTVKGDVHDIGKNLVGFMLESSGFRVIDLGTDVEPKLFVEAVKINSADVLAMSALLTTTMLGMTNVMDELEKAGLRSSVKVIVGGAPLSKKYAEDIQADAYGANAPQALEIVKGWLDGGLPSD